MQAPTRDSTRSGLLRPSLCVELPDALRAQVQAALGHLFELPWSPTELGPQSSAKGEPEIVRVVARDEGWRIEGQGISEGPLTDDAALVRLQDLLLDSAAQREKLCLFRGSVVARGSQSVLIVGDAGTCHTVLAVAMTALDFRLVSVGQAAFRPRPPSPVPLPLLFPLDADDRGALRLLPGRLEEPVERLTPDLFRPRAVTGARELTHALFPEARPGRLSLIRPVSATAARSRLSQALMLAPDDLSPFAVVAEVLRHARGVHVTVGEPPQAIEQLARLLPRWCVE